MVTSRRALLVLGMHRSGTSALTRLLNLYGAALPADVLPANAGNVTGYWEPSAVVAFHDRLLASIGSRWDDPREIPPTWFSSEAARGFATELAGLITSEFGSEPLFVVKDPRTCRLVPLWRDALGMLGIEPLAVLVVRHPLEVEASLQRRDGRPDGAGLLLWLQHVLAAEAGSRSLRRAFVTYDQVLADPGAVLDRLSATLGLAWPGRRAETEAAARTFVDPQLRHERSAEAPVTRSVPDVIQAVLAWFETASDGREPAVADLDAICEDLRRWEALFGPELGWHLREEQRWTAQAQIEAQHHSIVAAKLLACEQERRVRVDDRKADLERLAAERRQIAAHGAELEAQLADCRSREAALGDRVRAVESSTYWKLRTLLRGSSQPRS
jgi:hypothetical protein